MFFGVLHCLAWPGRGCEFILVLGGARSFFYFFEAEAVSIGSLRAQQAVAHGMEFVFWRRWMVVGETDAFRFSILFARTFQFGTVGHGSEKDSNAIWKILV